MSELVKISKDEFPYSKVWVKEDSVISNNFQLIFLIVLRREDRSLFYMGQLSKKCVVDSTSAPNLHSSGNLENYAWIYVHEDDWDQDGVLLGTSFLANYDIQIHC